MKKTTVQDPAATRRRRVALGAGLGLVVGGGIDLILGDSGWGLVIGILCGALLGYFVRFPLPLMEYPPYIMRRIILSAIFFLVTLFVSQWLLDQELEKSYQVLVAIAPSIPGALLVFSIGSAIAQLDELQRRIQLEGIGIAFGASVIIFLSYALLVEVGIPQVNWMFVPLLMVLLWGIGKLWTMWKYR
jgi:hypothetical protein